MNSEITKKLVNDFSDANQEVALLELSSISLKDVMSESQVNLNNTWLAILQLSKGD